MCILNLNGDVVLCNWLLVLKAFSCREWVRPLRLWHQLQTSICSSCYHRPICWWLRLVLPVLSVFPSLFLLSEIILVKLRHAVDARRDFQDDSAKKLAALE